jgi:catechol 2,3-dioxygenase-like lactoylglutathione lyase family enzyme
MAYRLGRLIDHLDLRVRDFKAARRFYRAVFAALGREADVEESEDWLNLDELYITRIAPGGAATGPLHLCFQAGDRASVARFHAEGLAAGGRDNGGPGLRDYHPGYYAAFLLDPDGNNIEAKADERATARTAPWIDVETG